MKKTILHIIYNLGRGGAETMLVAVLKELKEYNNIVVTLEPENHFGSELQCDKYYCLNLKSVALFPVAAIKLRKIIRQNNVDMVHSHLFWPTLIARIGTPKQIPLFTTIHAFIASSVEYKCWYIKWLDKVSYPLRKNTIIAVAKGALEEYFSFLKLSPYKKYTLYTFVDTAVFKTITNDNLKDKQVFKIVNVGALRTQKNQTFLLEAMYLLKQDNIELDIFGTGPLETTLKNQLTAFPCKVNLKGEVRDIQNRLPTYNLFVMSSTFEGFSLGVLEAMAMKVPLLLSDIVSFREQCEDTAIYFRLDDVRDFVEKIKLLKNNTDQLEQMSTQAYDRALQHFTLQHHMQELRKIYSENA